MYSASVVYWPPRRYNDQPFVLVHIQQSLTEDGPWETIDTQVLDPVDPDPTNPQARPLTVETITLPNAWLRVIWEDEQGDQSIPSNAVQNITDEDARSVALVSEIKPSIADVSALIRRRVSELATDTTVFTADTDPTATTVQALIDQNAAEVYSRCDAIRIGDAGLARAVVATAVALHIERGHFPQEQDDPNAILDDLRSDFNVKMGILADKSRLAWASRLP